jgi:hypothetical protein
MRGSARGAFFAGNGSACAAEAGSLLNALTRAPPPPQALHSKNTTPKWGERMARH